MVAFVALVLAVGFFALHRVKGQVLLSVEDGLRSSLLATSERIDAWVGQRKSMARQIGHHPRLVAITRRLLEVPATRRELLHSAALDEAREFFENDQELFPQTGFFIIDRRSRNVASLRNRDLGKVNIIQIAAPGRLEQVFAAGAQFVAPLPISTSTDRPAGSEKAGMFFVAPIQEPGGRVLATLALRMDPGGDFSRALELSRVGRTGESYVIDRQGRLLSKVRFAERLRGAGLIDEGASEILNVTVRDPGKALGPGSPPARTPARWPLTVMAASAISMANRDPGANGQPLIRVDTSGYRDYRGAPVFGAWLWNHELGIGLAYERETEEALASYHTMRASALGVLGFTLLLSLLGTSLALAMGERIRGVLSRAAADLERRVADRTSALVERQAAVRRADALLRTVVDNMPAAVFIKDATGRFQLVNKHYAEIHQTRDTAVLGKTVTDVYPPDRAEDYETADRRMREQRAALEREVTLRGEGDSRHFTSIVFPILDADGAISASGGIEIDITERKRAERALSDQLKFTEALINTLPNPLYVKDKDARYLTVNAAWEAVFGRSAEEVVGKTARELATGALAQGEAWHEEDLGLLQAGGSHTRESRCRFADDSERDTLEFLATFALGDGLTAGLVGVVVDVTELKSMQRELFAAKETAEAATQAKSDFLANMSHEIRTPMNAVMGLTALCLRTDLTAKQRDYLQKVHNAAEALLGVINDILDFSKIEAGKLELETVEFDLETVLDNLSAVVSIKAQEKGLELLFSRAIDVPSTLIGDPLRLGQVLINLASNAVKFTEAGEVVVSVRLLELSEDAQPRRARLEFSVRDTGIGMTPVQRSRLFRSFSQADTSTTRRYGGTGLGLSISQQLVGKMGGGPIAVNSEPGEGSTFSLEVVVGVGDEQPRRAFVPPEALRGMRVLVVDDNATARSILGEYLTSFGFRVRTAASGDEALRALAHEPAELVVMDWLMPELSGLETAVRIKTRREPEQAPRIILISAFGREALASRPHAEHVDGILTKPVNPSELFDAVMGSFGQKDERARKRRKGQLRVDGHGARVLLVEDNALNQQVARELLEQADFEVDTADHGREALAMIEPGRYDCVLMDVQMPVMDGYSVARAIRSDPRHAELPILAMTANAAVADRDRALQAGMNAHIPKPIDPSNLFDTLAQWVEKVRTHGTEEASPAPGREEALPPLDGIDTVAGLGRVGGSPTAYRRLLSRFLDDQSGAAEAIRSALRAGKQRDAVRLAHTLKGVAGTIGAERLQATAAELEQGLDQMPDARADTLTEPLEALLGVLAAELEQVLGVIGAVAKRPRAVASANGGGVEEADAPEVERALDELLDKLQSYDSQAEDLLDALLARIDGSALGSALRGVAERVRRYDLERAATELNDVLARRRSAGG